MKQAGGRGRGASDNEAEKWRREVGSYGPNKEVDVCNGIYVDKWICG